MSEFYKGKGNHGGYVPRCKACVKPYFTKRYVEKHDELNRKTHERYFVDIEKSRSIGRTRAAKYRKENPEKSKTIAKNWYQRNLEQVRADGRNRARLRRASGLHKEKDASAVIAARQKNPEKYNQIRKRYADKYPDRVKVTKNNNLSKRRAAPGHVTTKEWQRILLFYGRACGICKRPESEMPLTVDHFIPIVKGGDNTWRNVWPTCLPCNLKKRAKVPLEQFPPHVQIFERTGT